MVSILSLCLVLIALGQQVSANEIGLTMLKESCRSDDYKIGNSWDILEMLAALEDETHADRLDLELPDCRSRFHGPLKDLAEIIVDNKVSICSHRGVSRMSKFHWRYVMGTLDKKWAEHLPRDAPLPLVNFFIGYANAVSQTCMYELQANLQFTSEGKNEDAAQLLSGSMGRTLDTMKLGTIEPGKVSHYERFMLPWQLVLNKLKRRGKIALDTVDEDGDVVLALAKTNNPSHIWAMQDLCRYRLRPVYEQTTLPVMHLIDMGYGNPFIGNRKEIAANQVLQDWYVITQLCELMLGVNFYKDPSLPDNKVDMIEDVSEISNLESHDFKPRKQIASASGIKSPNKPGSLDDELLQTDGKKLRSLLRGQIKERARFYRKVFNTSWKNVILHPIKSFKAIFGLGKNKDVATPEKIKQLIQENDLELAADTEESGSSSDPLAIRESGSQVDHMMLASHLAYVTAILDFSGIVFILVSFTFLTCTMSGLVGLGR